MYRSCEINLICIFDPVLFRYFYFLYNPLTEIIHKHTCIDFLLYQFSFFGMQCIDVQWHFFLTSYQKPLNKALKASGLILLLAWTKAEAEGVAIEKSLNLRSSSLIGEAPIQRTIFMVVSKSSFLFLVKSVSGLTQKIEQTSKRFLIL